VIIQNAAAFERMIKIMKKSTRKNSDDSKIKSSNRDKRTQNIVEKCIDTEDVMHIIVNQKMRDVSIEQMLTHSFILLRVTILACVTQKMLGKEMLNHLDDVEQYYK